MQLLDYSCDNLQFHGKTSLSTGYVSNWIGQHCPRLVYGLQRYVVHVLTTAYRNGKALLSKEQPQPLVDILTPVLEKSDREFPQANLLPISYVWLLSCALPQCYLQVRCHRVDNTNNLSNTILLRPACKIFYIKRLIIIVDKPSIVHITGSAYLCAWCVCVDQRFTEGHNSRFDSQKNRQYLSKALDVTVQ